MTSGLPQPTSPDNDTTPYPTTSAVDISPLTGAFGKGLMDYGLAYVCTAIAGVSILGLEPFAFLNSFATNLITTANTAITNAASAVTSSATIAAGVSNNITGAVATTSPSGVGPAVQLLNATVQAGANAPVIDIYNTSATWTKRSGLTSASILLVGGGGGGAQGGILLGTSGAAGGGGGPGGYSVYTGVTAASLPSTAAVVVPLGGSGAGGAGVASYSDNFQRANSSTLGSSWRTDSGSQSAQVDNDTAQAFVPSTYVGETGCWNTWASALDTDNVLVQAQLASPSSSGGVASNNFTGIYCAAAASYSSSSLMVVFVASTGSGCKMFTQSNAPSGPYIANGSQTGQATVATTSTNATTSSLLALTRNVNVFTAYINGTQVMQWTDSSNTVPAGSGNRQWGIITETNWPAFQGQYCSPAISLAEARDVLWLSEAGANGGTASFNGSAYQVTGGSGGVAGGVDASSVRRPTTGSYLDTSSSWVGAAGTGNQSTSAVGGCGAANQSGFLPAGQAGGGGLNTGGGAAGTSSSLNGSPGASPTGGVYGPASGGGGGYFLPLGNTGIAGQGGAGGFPGGGGGGGGATQDAQGGNGPGGPGGDGQVVVTSYL